MPNALTNVVSVLLDDAQYRSLRKLSAFEGRKMSNYIRHLLLQEMVARGFYNPNEMFSDEDEEEADDDN